jgi:3-phenylpropionate/cinnamic acid dioxygenase small subunit
MNKVIDRPLAADPSASASASATPSDPPTGTPAGTRVPVGSDTYNRIVEFLYDEAKLLDDLRLKEWGVTLASDLTYNAPLRLTRSSNQLAASHVRTMQHFHDNHRSMMGRILRLTETKSAFAEDPPSRTRRLVTNVRVESSERSDEFKVLSYLLVTRSRFNFDDFDLISAERHDLLRRDGASFKLARREIQLDQAVLGTPNLGIFL